MQKNKNIFNSDLSDIPVYNLFCVPGVHFEEEYEWQSWGLVIRHIRDFSGMDQDVFGRLLKGFTRFQISRYETEQTEPPIDFWVKMMRTFGLNINWAITGRGVPYVLDYRDCEERKRFEKWIVLISDKVNFLKELKGW